MSGMPFGADTLLIPFELRGVPTRPVVARMSRLRPRGALFLRGVLQAETEDRALVGDAMAEERDG